jgi:serine/threonine protein kinase/tetratricopeptide (TPR) repeat protein
MSDLLDHLRAALGDRYAIEGEVGRGGMAVVFLAEDLKHHRRVAIKVLLPELAAGVGPDRFLREIEIAAGLDHPHILTLLDSGKADGILYFVMPFIEGQSLRDRLAHEQQLPIEEAVRIAREVADGLGHAHRHGVIHRDIKPGNIMLSEGHALIADFGVARAVGGEGQALTSTGLALGTPSYMSPEQASGGEGDARSDLYALGCVLYEMLAGEPPLIGPTPQATAAMRLTESATPLPVIRETVPGGLEQVVQRLLAKSPADRYGTAKKLVEALDRPELWTGSKPGRVSTKRVVVTVTALAVLAFGISSAQWFSGRTERVNIVPDRIAVLPFANATGDSSLDFLGQLAADRITTRFQLERVGEVVPLSVVAARAPGENSADRISHVAGETGAGIVVTGSYAADGDSLGFAIRIMDGASRSQAGYFESTVATADLPDPGLDEIESRLAGGLLFVFNQDPFWAYTVYPRVEAYRVFQEATQLQMDGELEKALDRYYDAWPLDTTFALTPYFAGGTAWDLYEHVTADSLNRVVGSRFRRTMTEAQRLHYDATRAWFEGELETAYRAQRRVVALRPELWYQRHLLGGYCLAINRPAELIETMLEAEDRLAEDPSGGESAAILSWHLRHLAWAYHMLGSHEEELETTRRLEETGWGDGLRTRYFQGRALAALGRTDGVRLALDQIESLADTTYRAGLMMLAVALEHRYHGHREESESAVSRALTWFEERPDRLAVELERQVVYGAALYHADRWDHSKQVLKPVQDASRLTVDAVGYLGLLAARRGDLGSAEEYSAELDRIGREQLNSRPQSWAYRARIAAVLGDRAQAVSHLKRAFDERLLYAPSPDLHAQYRFDFEAMADYGPYQELLRPRG